MEPLGWFIAGALAMAVFSGWLDTLIDEALEQHDDDRAD